MDDVMKHSLDLIETWRKWKNDPSSLDTFSDTFHEYIHGRMSKNFDDCFSFENDELWLNVADDFNFAEHTCGRIVLLDFFTYCCINCLHILPILHGIQREYANKLALIGVHSAKFDNERESDSITSAIQRYHIDYPVLNDSNLRLWRCFDVACWPTVIVFDTRLRPLLVLVGEADIDILPTFIDATVKQITNPPPAPIPPVKVGSTLTATVVDGVVGSDRLRFPGGLCLTQAPCGSHCLIISDSAHNRLLLVHTQLLSVLCVIGSGKAGLQDGAMSQCAFNSPQGVTCISAPISTCDRRRHCVVFVADTGNHAVRMVDLNEGVVSTLARGEEAGSLRSPWDLCVLEDRWLYISAAGSHQVWLYDLSKTDQWHSGDKTQPAHSADNDSSQVTKDGVLSVAAGCGQEGCRNNSYPARASFAQPSGLAWCGQLASLVLADAESSSIRRLEVAGGGERVQAVKTVVGGGIDPSDLFVFGDVDCSDPEPRATSVRLQHPLAVACDNSGDSVAIYVADTYNHKIKLVRACSPPTSGSAGSRGKLSFSCVTVCGGHKGCCDGAFQQARFDEPSALCLDEQRHILYVADTNNHRICRLNLQQHTVDTLKMRGFAGHDARDSSTCVHEEEVMASQLDPALSCTGGVCQLVVQVALPSTVTVSSQAPHRWSLDSLPGGGSGGWSVSPVSGALSCTSDGRGLNLTCRLAWPPADTWPTCHTAQLHVRLQLYVCSCVDGACYPRSVQCAVPLVLATEDRQRVQQSGEECITVLTLNTKHLTLPPTR